MYRDTLVMFAFRMHGQCEYNKDAQCTLSMTEQKYGKTAKIRYQTN